MQSWFLKAFVETANCQVGGTQLGFASYPLEKMNEIWEKKSWRSQMNLNNKIKGNSIQK